MGFLKVWGWAVGRTLNKEGKKIEIFQSLGEGNNEGMGRSAAKYGNTFPGQVISYRPAEDGFKLSTFDFIFNDLGVNNCTVSQATCISIPERIAYKAVRL